MNGCETRVRVSVKPDGGEWEIAGGAGVRVRAAGTRLYFYTITKQFDTTCKRHGWLGVAGAGRV